MIRGLAIVVTLAVGSIFFGQMILLLWDSWPVLSSGQLWRSGYWDYHSGIYHALAMVFGTLMVSIIALLLAFPIGVGAAIFTSEYLRGGTRGFVKVAIELLAGIPSVVYGLFGVAYLTKGFREPLQALGGTSGSSLLTAGVLLAIMVLPTMMTFADDAIRCVPKKLRESGLGLGLSKAQTIVHLVLPAAKSGIIAAAMLALARAMGETIAIFLVIGRSDRPFQWGDFEWSSIFKAGQTLTTKLGGAEIAIAYGDQIHWSALMALGLLLWIGIGVLNFMSQRIFRRTTMV